MICKHFSVYHAFGTTTEGIYLRTRSDGRLFNVARLRSETKVRKVLIRDMLFADDAAVATRTHEELQLLIDSFSHACKDFERTICSEADECRGTGHRSTGYELDDCELDVVFYFNYLCSTITDNLSLDSDIDKRIGKAASTLARLTARMWTSPKLSVKTKMTVYYACVSSTLLYVSETWTTLCRTGEKDQPIPIEKHPPYTVHILAVQRNQCWCPVSCWSSKYVHYA